MVTKVEKRQRRKHPARPSPPARSSRKPPRSSASPRGAPCARRRISTRASTSAKTGRSVSSPTCEPTRCGCPRRRWPPVRSFIGKQLRQGLSARGAQRLHLRRSAPGSRMRTRPSGPPTSRRRPEQVQQYLEPDQFRLYQLIWQRFVASQMTPAVYDMTIVDFDLGRLPASGPPARCWSSTATTRCTSKGVRPKRARRWTTCRPSRRSTVGERVEVREITPIQHFTEPPPRFSEASLVKELERLGIGRPSTYSADHLDAHGPRVREAGAAPVLPHRARRDWSRRSWSASSRRSSTSSSPRRWRTELDRIEDGELGWQQVLPDFYGPFSKALDAVDMNALVAEAHGLIAGRPGEGALSQVRRRGRAAAPVGSAPISPASTTRRPATT